MTLKGRVKALAKKEGISLPALEAELGFGNSTIVKWDKSTPNAEKLNAVAQYFGVTMDYLLNGTDIIIESFRTEQESPTCAQTKRLLTYYNALNDKGKFEAAKRVQELTHLSQYASDDIALLNAAHAIENTSLEDKQHDEDIMNDENF